MPAPVYTDFSTLATLRSDAGGSPRERLEEAARQFSSVLLQMALESMRDASPGGGMLDSQQSRFYRDMFDQQIALELGGRLGFGNLLVEQLAAALPPGSSGAEAYAEVSTATGGPQENGIGAANVAGGGFTRGRERP